MNLAQQPSPAAPLKGPSILPLHSAGLIRLAQIVGDKKKGIPAIFPVSKSTWWAGVKSGKYPQPVKLAVRCVAWKVSDIQDLLEGCEQTEEGQDGK